MLSLPAPCGGVIQVIEVLELTVGVHVLPPIVTVVAPVTKLVPVMVMDVPPAVGPLAGETEATVGAATYVNNEFAELVPPTVVTRMLTVPATCAGVVQVAEVAEATLTDVQAVPPTDIPVAPVRLVPVMVMVVAPVVGPLAGETEVTVGAAT
jgi:hypothetical protein